MKETLRKLKEYHNLLKREYIKIHFNGKSPAEQDLLLKMNKINQTFKDLGLNVYTYKI